MTQEQKLRLIQVCKTFDKNNLIKYWSTYVGDSVKDFEDSIWHKFFLPKFIQIYKECVSEYTFINTVIDSYKCLIGYSPTDYWLSKIQLLETKQYSHYEN